MEIREFSLSWRWTEPNQHPLPESVLKELIPLSIEHAAKFDNELYGHVSNARLSQNLYCSIKLFDSDRPCDALLESLNISNECEVIISWDYNTALKTTWKTFKENWEAFCYPSSDDVFIYPENKKWLLFYHHEESFEFGKRKA
jgi:hypothetical protein